ncbi:MAG: hypothetical protein K1060chlam1_01311 [Candidatus Anoxychlamydiales bacterium]|nr:hypothetical protein [Candidatus Anoxychlamydiales bacterium]
MASARRVAEIPSFIKAAPAEADKQKSLNPASVQPVANRIIGSLVAANMGQRTQIYLPAAEVRSFLELRASQAQTDEGGGQQAESTASSRRKKKKKRKKKNVQPNAVFQSSQASSVSAVKTSTQVTSQKSSSLFAAGISEGNLPPNVRFLSDEQEILLREILSTWQLGGILTLADLLGLELDRCYEELIENAQNIKTSQNYPAVQSTVNSLIKVLKDFKIGFEAHYCLVFISLLCESYAQNEAPEMAELIDNKFLYTREKACEIFSNRMNEDFETIKRELSALKQQFASHFSKSPKIREMKLRPLIEVEKQIDAILKRINLCVSLLKSEYAFPLLMDYNILGLCGKEACKVKSKEDAFLHFRRLARFQKDLLISAKKKRYLGLDLPVFEEFVSNIPERLSEKSLFEISKSSLDLISRLMEVQEDIFTELFDVLKGTLTHVQYCLNHQIPPCRKKTQAEFASDLFAKSMALSLVNSFAQDLNSIVDTILMPLVSDVYTIKITSYNRMVFNFFEIAENFRNPSTVDKNHFSILSSEKSFNPFFEQLQNDFKRIELTFFTAFSPFLEIFSEKIQRTYDAKSYYPLVWIETFVQIAPMLEKIFPEMLSKLVEFKKAYTKQLNPIISNLPFEKRILALQELQKLLLNSSQMVCRIILFCADLRALMDLYEIESLKTERFLLPKELCDLLELKELDEEIQKGLLVLSEEPTTSSSSEEGSDEGFEKEVKEDLVVLDEPQKIMKKSVEGDEKSLQKQTSSSSSLSQRAQKKQPVKKPEIVGKRSPKTPTKKTMPVKARKKAKPVEESHSGINIPRGAKVRDILKEIKDTLGLTPERISGSHLIFRDRGGSGNIAVMPRHGGGGTLPTGTAKSLQEQLSRFSPKKGE